MMAEAKTASLPNLAYVYHPVSFAPLSIAESADGLCRMIWVIDSSDPAAASMLKPPHISKRRPAPACLSTIGPRAGRVSPCGCRNSSGSTSTARPT